jgi:hypothetical protein
MSFQRRFRRSQPTQRISGPGELLQAVPYLLGFHPHRSLVLIGLTEGRLVVTARLDLADAETGAVPHALAAFVRGGASCAVAVVYDDEWLPHPAGDPAAQRLLDLLEDSCDDLGCELLDLLLVARGRWWALSCESLDCCPPDGRALPTEPSAFTAAATYAGIVALPDRGALEASMQPLPEDERERLDAAIVAAEQLALQETIAGHAEGYQRAANQALFEAARESDEPGWLPPPDDEAARFGAALSTTEIRDTVWMAVDDGDLDGRPLWRELARRLPRPYDATPAFLYGWAAWRAGDGALARIAAERALESNPRYSAAELLVAALSYGVDPRQVPKLRLSRSA